MRYITAGLVWFGRVGWGGVRYIMAGYTHTLGGKHGKSISS